MWRWLRDHRFSACKFRRQQPMGPYILDFYCIAARVNIEMDGSQHGYPEQQRAAAERDRWLAEQGIRVLRFWNGHLRREKDVVREAIWQTLQVQMPQPVPQYCRPGTGGRRSDDTAGTLD
ncbi:MAG TPA: endonuclease domain-containing protein [Candidatus Limnocylindria bacterium]|nr:endonuclease domain-containing protein [Candidatus Limnocylindria bacterium]